MTRLARPRTAAPSPNPFSLACEAVLRERAFTEHDLQRLWFEHLLPSRLDLPEGRRVDIIQTGWWNREGGPDFRDAAVRLDGGPVLHGDIELHLDARDWTAHGHHRDPSYNRVILHVALRGEAPVRLASGTLVPTAALSPAMKEEPAALLTSLPPESSTPAAWPGRCSPHLSTWPEDRVRRLLADAGRHRLGLKARRLMSHARRDGETQALWEALAEALGYKGNRTPLRLLARRCPWSALRDADALTREARLMGVAGFLPATEITTWADDNRSHAASLWRRWWPHRDEPGARPLPRSLWAPGTARPANHPQRRVAALARLVPRVPDLLSALAEWTGPALPRVTARHPFFERHATLRSRPAPRPIALIGAEREQAIAVNVLVPWLTGLGHLHALDLPAHLPPGPASSATRLVLQRLFGPDRAFRPRSQLEEQGLLHVLHGFCARDASDCTQCPFPEVLTRWTA